MSSEETIHIDSEEHTKTIAQDFAGTLKAGDIVCLYGTLGMGKSVFARAVIRTLCNNKDLDVPSPTFTLVQIYDEADMPSAPVWHFDLYRLEDADEIYETGWEEALGEAILIIEWPERLGALKPHNTIDIKISPGKTAEQRTLTIERHV